MDVWFVVCVGVCVRGSFMLLGGGGRRVCAAAIFREPRLRAWCRFCALFVLLFSFATTKMSGHSYCSLHSSLILPLRFLEVNSSIRRIGYGFCLVNALFMFSFCVVVNSCSNCCLWGTTAWHGRSVTNLRFSRNNERSVLVFEAGSH